VRKTAAQLLGAGAGALLCCCSSLSLDPVPLAGGSGAGNPGGTVVSAASVELSMVATGGGDQVLGIAGPLLKTGSVLDSTGSITVTDKGGLRLTLTQVVLSNVEPRFMLDSALRPDSLLSHMAEPPSGLSCDSNSIMLNGLHAFDAVEGKIDSADGQLRLPVARYSGIGIGFQEYHNSYQYPQPPPEYSRITMRGSFLYGGAMHDIIIEINYSPQPCRQQFRFGGGLFTLMAGDTTHLELQLAADTWFADVDFAAALANGSLYFDPWGALRITDGCYNPCVWGIQSSIATDFFASGRLVVY
jgi:hypothetical protein